MICVISKINFKGTQMITFNNELQHKRNQEWNQGDSYIFVGELSDTQDLEAKHFSDRFLIAIEPTEINGKTCIGVDSAGFLWYKEDGMIFKNVNINASISE